MPTTGWEKFRRFAATDMLFASVEIGDRNGRIALDRCRALAQIIKQVSQIQPNGFGNLYLTALANCAPGSPFFPVAYHGGGPAHFALAVESADLAVTAVQTATTLAEARHNLMTPSKRPLKPSARPPRRWPNNTA
jgi:uncharacterized protein